MTEHRQFIRRGALKALKSTAALARIIIPVTIAVVAMERLNLIAPVASFFTPVMRFIGLPGEAALPLFLGFFVNIYASIGAIIALELTASELTVIAVMILTSHSLPMEVPVLKFTGLSSLVSLALRFSAALLFGLIIHLFYTLAGRLG